MVVECKIYNARHGGRTCALRYQNANASARGFKPGAHDYNCRVCDIGRRMYEQGLHKEPIVNNIAKEMIVENENKIVKSETQGVALKKDGTPRKKPGPTPKAATANTWKKFDPTCEADNEKRRLVIDFSGYPELYACLEGMAKSELRPMDMQVLYLINKEIVF